MTLEKKLEVIYMITNDCFPINYEFDDEVINY